MAESLQPTIVLDDRGAIDDHAAPDDGPRVDNGSGANETACRQDRTGRNRSAGVNDRIRNRVADISKPTAAELGVAHSSVRHRIGGHGSERRPKIIDGAKVPQSGEGKTICIQVVGEKSHKLPAGQLRSFSDDRSVPSPTQQQQTTSRVHVTRRSRADRTAAGMRLVFVANDGIAVVAGTSASAPRRTASALSGEMFANRSAVVRSHLR